VETVEERIKRWMLIGLQDDKWIQLYPGADKWHPWFNDDKTVNREAMAKDAVEAWNINPANLYIVIQWANVVADVYENIKQDTGNG